MMPCGSACSHSSRSSSEPTTESMICQPPQRPQRHSSRVVSPFPSSQYAPSVLVAHEPCAQKGALALHLHHPQSFAHRGRGGGGGIERTSEMTKSSMVS